MDLQYGKSDEIFFSLSNLHFILSHFKPMHLIIEFHKDTVKALQETMYEN
jgi:hypothetical protein